MTITIFNIEKMVAKFGYLLTTLKKDKAAIFDNFDIHILCECDIIITSLDRMWWYTI